MGNSHYEAVKVKMHSVAESEGRLGQQEQRPSHDVMLYVKALIKIKTKAPPEAAAWFPSIRGGKWLFSSASAHLASGWKRSGCNSRLVDCSFIDGSWTTTGSVRRFYAASWRGSQSELPHFCHHPRHLSCHQRMANYRSDADKCPSF